MAMTPSKFDSSHGTSARSASYSFGGLIIGLRMNIVPEVHESYRAQWGRQEGFTKECSWGGCAALVWVSKSGRRCKSGHRFEDYRNSL